MNCTSVATGDQQGAATPDERNAPGGFVQALALADLADGSNRAVSVGGKCVLLCHLDSKVYAVSNVCSHAQQALEKGRMRNGWIACPLHGARFELATGKAMNPPAKQPIETYEVRVVDNWIEVRL